MSTRVRGGAGFGWGPNVRITESPYPEDQIAPRSGTFGGGSLREVDHVLLLEGLNQKRRTGGTRIRTLGADSSDLVMLNPNRPVIDIPTAPQVAKEPGVLADGPQLQVGPYFTIPYNALAEGYQVHLTHKIVSSSKLYFHLASWAVDAIWQVSQSQGLDGGWLAGAATEWKAGPGSASSPFAKDGKSLWAKDHPTLPFGAPLPDNTGGNQWLYPRFNQSPNGETVYLKERYVSHGGAPGAVRGVGGVMVPDDQVWFVDYFMGEDPIGKFTHPDTKEKWAIYCEIRSDKFVFTFRKWRESKPWYKKLWGWLKELAADVIHLVTDVLKILKDLVACPLARAKLDDLAKMVTSKTPGQCGVASSAASMYATQTGLACHEIQQVLDGAETQVVKTVATKIVDKLCGPPATDGSEPLKNPFKLNLAIKIALGGAAVAGVYFLVR